MDRAPRSGVRVSLNAVGLRPGGRGFARLKRVVRNGHPVGTPLHDDFSDENYRLRSR
jgi:hypothetical protein